MQRTPEAGRPPESKSVDSIGQQQQAQAQPASWSAIAAQGAAKGSGSPPAAGSSSRSHSSGLSHRGSATDLRQEQVRASFRWQSAHAGACVCRHRRAAALPHIGTICSADHAWYSGECPAWKSHLSGGSLVKAVSGSAPSLRRVGAWRRNPINKQRALAVPGAVQHICSIEAQIPHRLRPQCSSVQQVGSTAHARTCSSPPAPLPPLPECQHNTNNLQSTCEPGA